MSNIYNIQFSYNNNYYKDGFIKINQKYNYSKLIISTNNNIIIFNEYIFNDNLNIIFNDNKLECMINDIMIRFNYTDINEWINFKIEIIELINIKNEIRQFYNYNFFL